MQVPDITKDSINSCRHIDGFGFDFDNPDAYEAPSTAKHDTATHSTSLYQTKSLIACGMDARCAAALIISFGIEDWSGDLLARLGGNGFDNTALSEMYLPAYYQQMKYMKEAFHKKEIQEDR